VICVTRQRDGQNRSSRHQCGPDVPFLAWLVTKLKGRGHPSFHFFLAMKLPILSILLCFLVASTAVPGVLRFVVRLSSNCEFQFDRVQDNPPRLRPRAKLKLALNNLLAISRVALSADLAIPCVLQRQTRSDFRDFVLALAGCVLQWHSFWRIRVSWKLRRLWRLPQQRLQRLRRRLRWLRRLRRLRLPVGRLRRLRCLSLRRLWRLRRLRRLWRLRRLRRRQRRRLQLYRLPCRSSGALGPRGPALRVRGYRDPACRRGWLSCWTSVSRFASLLMFLQLPYVICATQLLRCPFSWSNLNFFAFGIAEFCWTQWSGPDSPGRSLGCRRSALRMRSDGMTTWGRFVMCSVFR
jgi:hypothetical protein